MTGSTLPRQPYAIDGATVGCMATFPGRFATLSSVVASIAPQVDRLYVYVNNTTEGMPDLSVHSNVVVLDGREHAGDLSANGKIFPLQFLRHCFVLTLDDDFLYPADYAARLHAFSAACSHRCCLTVHGSIFPKSVDWYYDRLKSFISIGELRHAQLVSLAGSGTFAFHQNTLDCRTEDFLPDVMVDLRFSLLARDAGLPIFAVPRRKSWLQVVRYEGLWEVMKRGMTHHTIEARRYDWSFAVYRKIAIDALEAAGIAPADPRLALDPGLIRGLATGDPPEFWRVGVRSFGARGKYLQLLGAE